MVSALQMLKEEIARQDKPENRINYQQFFKEELKEPFGLKTPILRKISNQCFREVKGRPKKEILDLCDKILESDLRYGRFVTFEWASKVQKDFVAGDFRKFESWLKKYVDNWGKCDHLCCSVIGPLVLRFPELENRTRKWTKSKVRWLRRAAAVTLIAPVKNRILLDEVFATAEVLLKDQDDMVQKGYGWMLKEASNVYPDEVFAFVMRHRAEMPRTALRYAIEKYPATKRKEAMA